MTFTEVSGDCGPVQPQVTQLGGNLDVGPDCSLAASDRISDNECKLERKLQCVESGGGFSESTVVSTQEDDSGSLITGIATVTLRDADRVLVCTSTYRLRATRQ